MGQCPICGGTGRLHHWLPRGCLTCAARLCEGPDGINNLGLDTRTRNCLLNAGIWKIEEVRRLPKAGLLRIHNMGQRSVARLQEALAKIPVVVEPNEAEIADVVGGLFAIARGLHAVAAALDGRRRPAHAFSAEKPDELLDLIDRAFNVQPTGGTNGRQVDAGRIPKNPR